ncbi:MAG: hypothetical protein LBM08_06855, partial [Dysgonamonadaceae bacterium]|nr:hypothetical protein [Dysgonamonadaceae bacterium]
EKAVTFLEVASKGFFKYFCNSKFLKQKNMARDIAVTPVVTGKDAVRLLKEIEENQHKIADRAILKRIKESTQYIESLTVSSAPQTAFAILSCYQNRPAGDFKTSVKVRFGRANYR